MYVRKSMGIPIGISNVAKVGGSEQQSFGPIKSPSSRVTAQQTPATISASDNQNQDELSRST